MKKTFLYLSILSLASCVAPEKMRQQQLKLVEQSYKKELRNQQNGKHLGTYRANWKKAKSDIFKRNPKVIQANFRIVDSVERRMRLWKDLIPSLNIALSDSASVGDISDLFVDTNFRVSSYLNFGNLVNMPARAATLRMSTMASEFQAELVMRNEVIGLYRLFREQELLDLEEQALRWEINLLTEGTVDKTSIGYQIELEALEKKREDFEKKKKQWRERVGEATMSTYSEVRLNGHDLPNIYYKAEDIDFTDSSRWGTLQMNLLALELVAEESNLLKAYRRYLPSPTLGVTAPPLFSTNSNSDFNLDEVRVTPSVNWRLDTRGAIGSQIARIKRSKPIKKWVRDKRTRAEVAKLLEGKAALLEVQRDLKEQKELIREYKALVAEGLIKDISAAIKQMQSMRATELALRAAEVDICTSFWLLDESRWGETTKQWKKERLKMEKKSRKKK